jgi:hypothetical protein
MSTDAAYIAALWEHPTLCGSVRRAVPHPRGQQRDDSAGINEQMAVSLEAAQKDGVLLRNRVMMSPEGPVLLQYWRTYEDLDRWARTQPHSWLVALATGERRRRSWLYHETYQATTAEAIYGHGARPVGPATFCSTQEVPPTKVVPASASSASPGLSQPGGARQTVAKSNLLSTGTPPRSVLSTTQ